MDLNCSESYGTARTPRGYAKSYAGEVEFEIKDVRGRILKRIREPNIVKIFAKEILAHRLPHSKIWDPTAGTGSGAWVSHNIDLDEFSAKYIAFGASFDADGNPLDAADTRFYSKDAVSGGYIPVSLGAGAEYDGGLINPVPISEPSRPLKRIERVYFETSYQPAGTPLLQADVRAINNVIVMETTLRKDEYNGYAISASDHFTLTEVALVGAKELSTSLGACECAPRDIFLTGTADNNDALLVSASGTATVSINSAETEVDMIKEGDQVKIVAAGTTAAADSVLNQLNPYYLVISKAVGGRDITLDRAPVDQDNVVLSGDVGILRDGFRIFSHRILTAPVKKSSMFEIVVRWRIIMN
jgi:hypothetical protein